MKETKEHIIPCQDRRDLEARRNTLKRAAKKDGVFLRCEGNTLHVKNGNSFTFVIEPSVPEFKDDPVIICGVDLATGKDMTTTRSMAHRAARDMME
jgi:hypothetical protein